MITRTLLVSYCLSASAYQNGFVYRIEHEMHYWLHIYVFFFWIEVIGELRKISCYTLFSYILKQFCGTEIRHWPGKYTDHTL